MCGCRCRMQLRFSEYAVNDRVAHCVTQDSTRQHVVCRIRCDTPSVTLGPHLCRSTRRTSEIAVQRAAESHRVKAVEGKNMTTVAQITDLHVREPGTLHFGELDTARMLLASVVHLNQLAPTPDIVIITGDLTDGGKPKEYADLR